MAVLINEKNEKTSYTVGQIKALVDNFVDVNGSSAKSAKTIVISQDVISQIMGSGEYGAIRAEFARDSSESDDHFLLVYGVKDVKSGLEAESTQVLQILCPSSACPE